MLDFIKLLTSSKAKTFEKEFEYCMKLSRGSLTLPSVDLTHYVAKSFAMLDAAYKLIVEANLTERYAEEVVLTTNTSTQPFLCENTRTSNLSIKFFVISANNIRRDVQRFEHRRKRHRINE